MRATLLEASGAFWSRSRFLLDSFSAVRITTCSWCWHPQGDVTERVQGRRGASGQVAQLVEQWTENPRVGGSIPSLAIKKPLVERLFRLLSAAWGAYGRPAHRRLHSRRR